MYVKSTLPSVNFFLNRGWHLTHKVPAFLSNESQGCPFVKERFYQFFVPGKDLKLECSGNSGLVLDSCLAQGPYSHNSPVLGPYPTINFQEIRSYSNCKKILMTLFLLSIDTTSWT
jgi:hypothetical protein